MLGAAARAARLLELERGTDVLTRAMNGSRTAITAYLRRWSEGERRGLEELVEAVEGELRRLAVSHLSRESPNHSLQPTELISEAYLRLAQQRTTSWKSRSHFFAFASQLIRRILVDHHRAAHSQRRGGEVKKVTLSNGLAKSSDQDIELLALEQALQRLEEHDARKVRIVELKFFGGLTIQQIASVLETSPSSVKREWRLSRLWLRRFLGSGTPAQD